MAESGRKRHPAKMVGAERPPVGSNPTLSAMKDVIYAILGKRFCGWCGDRGDTLFDRLMRYNIAMRTADRHWWEKAAMRIQEYTDKVPIWKLGRLWHFRFHEKKPYYDEPDCELCNQQKVVEENC